MNQWCDKGNLLRRPIFSPDAGGRKNPAMLTIEMKIPGRMKLKM